MLGAGLINFRCGPAALRRIRPSRRPKAGSVVGATLHRQFALSARTRAPVAALLELQATVRRVEQVSRAEPLAPEEVGRIVSALEQACRDGQLIDASTWRDVHSIAVGSTDGFQAGQSVLAAGRRAGLRPAPSMLQAQWAAACSSKMPWKALYYVEELLQDHCCVDDEPDAEALAQVQPLLGAWLLELQEVAHGKPLDSEVDLALVCAWDWYAVAACHARSLVLQRLREPETAEELLHMFAQRMQPRMSTSHSNRLDIFWHADVPGSADVGGLPTFVKQPPLNLPGGVRAAGLAGAFGGAGEGDDDAEEANEGSSVTVDAGSILEALSHLSSADDSESGDEGSGSGSDDDADTISFAQVNHGSFLQESILYAKNMEKLVEQLAVQQDAPAAEQEGFSLPRSAGASAQSDIGSDSLRFVQRILLRWNTSMLREQRAASAYTAGAVNDVSVRGTLRRVGRVLKHTASQQQAWAIEAAGPGFDAELPVPAFMKVGVHWGAVSQPVHTGAQGVALAPLSKKVMQRAYVQWVVGQASELLQEHYPHLSAAERRRASRLLHRLAQADAALLERCLALNVAHSILEQQSWVPAPSERTGWFPTLQEQGVDGAAGPVHFSTEHSSLESTDADLSRFGAPRLPAAASKALQRVLSLASHSLPSSAMSMESSTASEGMLGALKEAWQAFASVGGHGMSVADIPGEPPVEAVQLDARAFVSLLGLHPSPDSTLSAGEWLGRYLVDTDALLQFVHWAVGQVEGGAEAPTLQLGTKDAHELGLQVNRCVQLPAALRRAGIQAPTVSRFASEPVYDFGAGTGGNTRWSSFSELWPASMFSHQEIRAAACRAAATADVDPTTPDSRSRPLAKVREEL